MKHSAAQYAHALFRHAADTPQARIPDLIDAFLGLLRRHRTRRLLPRILAAYLVLSDEHAGKIRAHASLAREGSASGLEKSLAAALGSPVHLSTAQHPALLGGAVLRVRDTRVDGSITATLHQLRRRLSPSTATQLSHS